MCACPRVRSCSTIKRKKRWGLHFICVDAETTTMSTARLASMAHTRHTLGVQLGSFPRSHTHTHVSHTRTCLSHTHARVTHTHTRTCLSHTHRSGACKCTVSSPEWPCFHQLKGKELSWSKHQAGAVEPVAWIRVHEVYLASMHVHKICPEIKLFSPLLLLCKPQVLFCVSPRPRKTE